MKKGLFSTTLPLDCIGEVLSCIPDTKTLFKLFLLSKSVYEYVQTSPHVAAQISFKMKDTTLSRPVSYVSRLRIYGLEVFQKFIDVYSRKGYFKNLKQLKILSTNEVDSFGDTTTFLNKINKYYPNLESLFGGKWRRKKTFANLKYVKDTFSVLCEYINSSKKLKHIELYFKGGEKNGDKIDCKSNDPVSKIENDLLELCSFYDGDCSKYSWNIIIKKSCKNLKNRREDLEEEDMTLLRSKKIIPKLHIFLKILCIFGYEQDLYFDDFAAALNCSPNVEEIATNNYSIKDKDHPDITRKGFKELFIPKNPREMDRDDLRSIIKKNMKTMYKDHTDSELENIARSCAFVIGRGQESLIFSFSPPYYHKPEITKLEEHKKLKSFEVWGHDMFNILDFFKRFILKCPKLNLISLDEESIREADNIVECYQVQEYIEFYCEDIGRKMIVSFFR